MQGIRANIFRAAGWTAMVLAMACGSSALGENIRLSTGEVLSVTIIEANDQTIRFVHPVLGELTLPRGVVEILPAAPPAEGQPAKAQATPEGTEPAAAPSAPPTSPPAAPPPAPVETLVVTEPPPPNPWRFKFTFAGAASSGNTETANLVTKFTAVRETPQLKTAFDIGYFYGQSDSVRSENRLSTGVRNDWLNPDSKWFYFADARYDYDEFQSWDQRVTGHVGIGYKLIEPPDWRMNLLAGIGAVKEFGSDNEDVRPEALFGAEGEWKIADKQSLKFDTTIFPDLVELGEYRWVNNAAWSMLVDEKTNLSLTAGVAHEFQSRVDEGRKHNDLRVFAGVDWAF